MFLPSLSSENSMFSHLNVFLSSMCVQSSATMTVGIWKQVCQNSFASFNSQNVSGKWIQFVDFSILSTAYYYALSQTYRNLLTPAWSSYFNFIYTHKLLAKSRPSGKTESVPNWINITTINSESNICIKIP